MFSIIQWNSEVAVVDISKSQQKKAQVRVT